MLLVRTPSISLNDDYVVRGDAAALEALCAAVS
jgi:hypothetical protein